MTRNGTSSPDSPTALSLNGTASATQSAPYLLFESRGQLCGIEASAVREVLLLPELAPLDGAPHWVGVLDVRGRIVPVVEAGELSGSPPHRVQTSDCVVVLEGEDGAFLGLIVERVRDVATLETVSELQTHGATPGLARADGEMVRLLSLPHLLGFASRETGASSPARPFCPDASPQEREVFAERARALRAPSNNPASSPTGSFSLVAVRLGEETFGLDLDWVREFAAHLPVTPVPGGPDDLLGLVNRRGEVVPLLDLRVALGLPTLEQAGSDIVFLEGEGVCLGLAVSAVLGVFSPLPGELLPPPATNSTEGVRAAARYDGQTIGVLDLEVLMRRGGWMESR